MLRSVSVYFASVLVLGYLISGVAACGGGGSGIIVARVAGRSISQADVDHWLPIQAILSHQLQPQHPMPSGVVPDPPNFTACVSYLASSPSGLVQSGARPNATELKSRCGEEYASLKRAVVSFLITANWLLGEGQEQGIEITGGEVAQQIAALKRELLIANQDAFKRRLRLTHETLSDVMFRARVQLLEQKLFVEREHRLAEALNPSRSRLSAGERASRMRQAAESVQRFTRKWVAKTTCVRGYVVPDCSEYSGPLHAEPML